MNTLAKNIFFGLVALFVIISTVFQFIIFGELTSVCGEEVATAPLIAGITLASSFVFNGLWLYGTGRCVCNKVKMTGSDKIRRAALLLWTAVTTVGVTSAGATLGQMKLYATACPAFNSDIDVETLQYASVILLILSIAVPHAYPKKKTCNDPSISVVSNDGNPLSLQGNNKKRKLVFI
tara:strand:- start:2266 stop:2802 length:537 start_codon:yes stop_codon:yes gene_type:complete